MVYDALGNLRKEIARRQGLIDENEFRFVWITDFPLFEYSEADKVLHPVIIPLPCQIWMIWKNLVKMNPKNSFPCL